MLINYVNLNYKLKFMKNFNFLILIIFFFTLSGCETVEKKSQKILKEEEEKLEKFIGQPVSELKIVMGNPDTEMKNDKGMTIFVYKKKKYGITCTRSFEINDGGTVIGFTSKGCF